jgi:large-conductance mechanosensitive channel
MENINASSNILNFTLENMGTGASFIIALSSKDLIYSFVNDVLMPLMNNYLFLVKNDKINFKNLFINLITWILVLINTYLFYTLFYSLLFGLNKKKLNKKEYNKNEY